MLRVTYVLLIPLFLVSAGMPAAPHPDFCLPPPPAATAPSLAAPPPAPGLPEVKTILVLRIGFSNSPNRFDTNTMAATNRRITAFWKEMSRGSLELAWKIHPQSATAPFASPSAGEDRTQLFIRLSAYRDELARSLGLQAGRDYDIIAAFYPYGGALGQAQSSSTITLLGDYSPEVMAHEPGHCLGLLHANAIDAGTDILGTPGNTGQHVEYGNVFDIMGRSSFGHLNAASKRRLGYLDAEEVREDPPSGTYRLYAHDNAVHKGRLAALHLRVGAYGYWVEYRSRSQASGAVEGAQILFEGFQGGYKAYETWLLDMTPGSRQGGAMADIEDAALGVDREFRERHGGVTFRTMAVSNAGRNEESWVEVRITRPGSGILIQPARRFPIRPGARLVGDRFQFLLEWQGRRRNVLGAE